MSERRLRTAPPRRHQSLRTAMLRKRQPPCLLESILGQGAYVMPPVIDTPNDDHVEAHTLQRARPQARGARPGCWRSLVHGVATI